MNPSKNVEAGLPSTEVLSKMVPQPIRDAVNLADYALTAVSYFKDAVSTNEPVGTIVYNNFYEWSDEYCGVSQGVKDWTNNQFLSSLCSVRFFQSLANAQDAASKGEIAEVNHYGADAERFLDCSENLPSLVKETLIEPAINGTYERKAFTRSIEIGIKELEDAIPTRNESDIGGSLGNVCLNFRMFEASVFPDSADKIRDEALSVGTNLLPRGMSVVDAAKVMVNGLRTLNCEKEDYVLICGEALIDKACRIWLTDHTKE